MSFVQNRIEEQQLSLFDPLNTLTEREKKFLDKSWAKYFAEFIFPKIDEIPYAVLYSDKDSRPNTPVNVQIGALLIKELTNLSDDELLESLMFDIRFQYALHTASFAEQPLSDSSTPAWQTSQKKWQKPVRSLNICGITQKRMTGTVSYTTTTVRKLPQR